MHRAPHKGDATAHNLPWAEIGDICDFLSQHARLRHNVITGRVEEEIKLKEKKGKEKNELKERKELKEKKGKRKMN